MTVSVETEHPSGLCEPKVVGKMVNGTKQHGSNQDGLVDSMRLEQTTPSNYRETDEERKTTDEDSQAVLALRNLIFDICNQNGGGHGGSALGMAAIGVALYKHIMRYNPSDPSWFDRDRFVLSNGKRGYQFFLSCDIY